MRDDLNTSLPLTAVTWSQPHGIRKDDGTALYARALYVLPLDTPD